MTYDTETGGCEEFKTNSIVKKSAWPHLKHFQVIISLRGNIRDAKIFTKHNVSLLVYGFVCLSSEKVTRKETFLHHGYLAYANKNKKLMKI